MSVVLPYNELHTQLTPEQNQAALEKVAAIIKQNQLRSISMAIVIPYTGKSFDESAAEMGLGDIFARLDAGEHITQVNDQPCEETEEGNNEASIKM